LLLCDPDRVEASNLSRCALFRAADQGRPKVEVAADALRDLAPGLRVEARARPLVHGVGLAELRDADLVLSCLDSRSARLQLAGRCNLVRAPSIDGGTQPWGGELRPYLDPDGPCYGCGLGAAARAIADAPWSCLDQREPGAEGATAAASVLVGGWMALYALRRLMAQDCPSDTLHIDGGAGRTRAVHIERDPDCPLHTPMGRVRRVTLGNSATLGQLLATLPAGAVPLAWAEVQEALDCGGCGYHAEQWGPPMARDCPRCGRGLRVHTTLELDRAPPGMRLADLGVAPREILAVRTGDGLEWLELSDG
jgi:hypothetical protein